jgi:hypothetical protein
VQLLSHGAKLAHIQRREKMQFGYKPQDYRMSRSHQRAHGRHVYMQKLAKEAMKKWLAEQKKSKKKSVN